MSERVKSTFSFQLAALISTVLGKPLAPSPYGSTGSLGVSQTL